MDNPEPRTELNARTTRPRKLGRFKISFAFLDECWAEALPVMAKCVIVRAEADYARSLVEYTALSDAFEVVDRGDDIPLYTPIISRSRVKFEKEVK